MLIKVLPTSVYVDRACRGKGIGGLLLQALEKTAKENSFYKIVLFTFPFNELGQNLYNKMGYRQVGIFKNQGILDGRFIKYNGNGKIAIDKKPLDCSKGFCAKVRLDKEAAQISLAPFNLFYLRLT